MTNFLNVFNNFFGISKRIFFFRSALIFVAGVALKISLFFLPSLKLILICVGATPSQCFPFVLSLVHTVLACCFSFSSYFSFWVQQAYDIQPPPPFPLPTLLNWNM